MPKPTTPAAKAFHYAEDDLGVNEVYKEALQCRGLLDDCLTNLSNKRDERRGLESQLDDAEMEVAADEWGKHPEMSAARMKDHYKVALSGDPTVRKIRGDLALVVSEIDGLEMDREIIRADINIAVARLGELGGLLNYFAAIKQATIADKAKEKSA